jgi:hypothetical protein
VFPAIIAVLLAANVPIPRASATRTPHAPAIDGSLADSVWAAAPPLDAFTQQYPNDGALPSEHTTMRILYDDDALYVGFECEHLRTPIHERLTRRDRDSESEWISVLIDPRGEGKSAVAFAVNVSGVLLDAIIADQNNWNVDWDENWEARTARTATGWSAEIRIPFRVLRFDAALPVQSWGFQAERYIAHIQEVDYWSYYPRDVANPISHFGRLDDLVGIKRSGTLELRPFVTGDVRRLDATDTTTARGYDAEGSAGLDLKWHIAQDLTLDAALRPDFAQVEADQVILNLTNYETFLPEKRPLFLEGSEIFSLPLQVFYSRRIGFAPTTPTLRTDTTTTTGPGGALIASALTEKLVNVPSPATIYTAAKLAGRMGADWTVGALSALTGRNEVVVENATTGARSTRLVAPTTSYNVLRLRREWGSMGYVGVMGTGATSFETNGGYPVVPNVAAGGGDLQLCPSGAMPTVGSRCFRDSYVAAVDASLRSPSGDYVVSGVLLESLIHGGPAAVQLDGTSIGSGAHAPGGWLRVAKEGGQHLLASATYTGAGRTLDYNDLGFMPRQNVHELKTSIGYRTLDSGRFTVETSSAFEVTQRRSLAGLDLGQLYELNSRLRLRNFWNIFVAADLAPSHFDDREVGDGTALERAGYLGGRLDLGTDPKRRVVLSLSAQGQLIQNHAQAFIAQGTLTWAPLPQFEISFVPQLTWSAGEFRYTAQTVTSATDPAVSDPVFGKLSAISPSGTLRAAYTFAPHLSLQTYAQVFLAAGRFTDLRATSATPGQRVYLSDLRSAPSPTNAMLSATPDFEEAALNLNVVLRWEYRLGSTLFLVYSRSQVPGLSNVFAPASLQPSALGTRASADVILLKFNYWWSS